MIVLIMKRIFKTCCFTLSLALCISCSSSYRHVLTTHVYDGPRKKPIDLAYIYIPSFDELSRPNTPFFSNINELPIPSNWTAGFMPNGQGTTIWNGRRHEKTVLSVDGFDYHEENKQLQFLGVDSTFFDDKFYLRNDIIIKYPQETKPHSLWNDVTYRGSRRLIAVPPGHHSITIRYDIPIHKNCEKYQLETSNDGGPSRLITTVDTVTGQRHTSIEQSYPSSTMSSTQLKCQETRFYISGQKYDEKSDLFQSQYFGFGASNFEAGYVYYMVPQKTNTTIGDINIQFFYYKRPFSDFSKLYKTRWGEKGDNLQGFLGDILW